MPAASMHCPPTSGLRLRVTVGDVDIVEGQAAAAVTGKVRVRGDGGTAWNDWRRSDVIEGGVRDEPFTSIALFLSPCSDDGLQCGELGSLLEPGELSLSDETADDVSCVPRQLGPAALFPSVPVDSDRT